MKALLAKISFHNAIGLFIGEHEVCVSCVAATPLGPVQTAAASEQYTSDNLGEVVERLLKPLSSHKQQLPITMGLPCSKLFFSTRLTTTSGGTASPEAVLQKSLSLSNISVDDLTVDLQKYSVNKMPVASVAACRKKYLANIINTLGRVGVRPIRTEPAPNALIRTAVQQYRSPRRGKMVLRVFLNATHGLAIVVSGGMALAWRQFVLPEFSEGFAILSAARTLKTQVKHYGIDSTLDFAVIHGRSDIHERLIQDQFPSDIGTRVIWNEGPAFDGPATAFGLAVGCLEQDEAAFDLSRLIKVRASIREIFPWWDLTFATALVIAMGVTLGFHTAQLDEKYIILRTKCSGYQSLSSTDQQAKLYKDAKDLEQKIEAVKRFVETRMNWTDYTSDISVRLPKGAYITSLQGFNILDANMKNARGGRKSLGFRVLASGPKDDLSRTPRDVDDFIKSLQNNPLLKRDFSNVTISDIRPAPSKDAKFNVVGFAVNCKPGGKK